MRLLASALAMAISASILAISWVWRFWAERSADSARFSASATRERMSSSAD